jgi:hypothetical protein
MDYKRISKKYYHKPEPAKKVWIKPEVKPIGALLFWSEFLQGYFWWLLDKSALKDIQTDPEYCIVPIYSTSEINIMLETKNKNERRQLHLLKKVFGAKIIRWIKEV